MPLAITIFPPGSSYAKDGPKNAIRYEVGKPTNFRDGAGKRIDVTKISGSSTRATITLADGTEVTYAMPYELVEPAE